MGRQGPRYDGVETRGTTEVDPAGTDGPGGPSASRGLAVWGAPAVSHFPKSAPSTWIPSETTLAGVPALQALSRLCPGAEPEALRASLLNPGGHESHRKHIGAPGGENAECQLSSLPRITRRKIEDNSQVT